MADRRLRLVGASPREMLLFAAERAYIDVRLLLITAGLKRFGLGAAHLVLADLERDGLVRRDPRPRNSDRYRITDRGEYERARLRVAGSHVAASAPPSPPPPESEALCA